MALAAVKQKRLINSAEDLSSNRASLCGSDLGNLAEILEDDYKFISAEPRHGVDFAYAILNSPSGLLEKQIADMMAQRIVQ